MVYMVLTFCVCVCVCVGGGGGWREVGEEGTAGRGGGKLLVIRVYVPKLIFSICTTSLNSLKYDYLDSF